VAGERRALPGNDFSQSRRRRVGLRCVFVVKYFLSLYLVTAELRENTVIKEAGTADSKLQET
jgi:hypothetical protein